MTSLPIYKKTMNRLNQILDKLFIYSDPYKTDDVSCKCLICGYQTEGYYHDEKKANQEVRQHIEFAHPEVWKD